MSGECSMNGREDERVSVVDLYVLAWISFK
jgi:hypothetical protein